MTTPTGSFNGKFIYRVSSDKPVYVIEGELIYDQPRGAEAVFEIRGNYIHVFGRGSVAVYETTTFASSDVGTGFLKSVESTSEEMKSP